MLVSLCLCSAKLMDIYIMVYMLYYMVCVWGGRGRGVACTHKPRAPGENTIPRRLKFPNEIVLLFVGTCAVLYSTILCCTLFYHYIAIYIALSLYTRYITLLFV